MVFACAFTLSHSSLKFRPSTSKPTLTTNDMINVFARRVPDFSASSVRAHLQYQPSQLDSQGHDAPTTLHFGLRRQKERLSSQANLTGSDPHSEWLTRCNAS